jgi:hypothetical protein
MKALFTFRVTQVCGETQPLFVTQVYVYAP